MDKERLIKNCGIEIGNVVVSTMGRDKGNFFIVAGVEENYVYLLDGAIRKVDRPKKKKIKHIKLTDFRDETIATKIINRHKITNQDIKRALKELPLETL